MYVSVDSEDSSRSLFGFGSFSGFSGLTVVFCGAASSRPSTVLVFGRISSWRFAGLWFSAETSAGLENVYCHDTRADLNPYFSGSAPTDCTSSSTGGVRVNQTYLVSGSWYRPSQVDYSVKSGKEITGFHMDSIQSGYYASERTYLQTLEFWVR